jgi:hypothetical protein
VVADSDIDPRPLPGTFLIPQALLVVADSDIDPTMDCMVLTGGKVMLGYKITPDDDSSHEEAARPLFRFASG